MIRERVPQARRILEESETFQEGLARIRAEVDSRANGDNLCKDFKRAGLEKPTSYIGLRLLTRRNGDGQRQGVQEGVSGRTLFAVSSSSPVQTPAAVMPETGHLQHTASGLSKILIVPDTHIPYHHIPSWCCLLEVARRWGPDIGLILGDLPDFYEVSNHPKDPARVLSFDDEIAAVDCELERLNSLSIPRWIYCEGNHETRYQRYVNSNAPALARLRGTANNAQNLLDVKRFGWEWVPYGHHASIGKLNFMHDCGHAGMYAAKQSVAAFGGNIIFGHTHRAGAHYESTVNGDRHVGWTMGWLGDPECIDYRHRARVLRESQHGFGVAYVENATGLGWVNFIPVIDGRAVVDGVMYDGRMYDLGEAA